jgi:hypothetical protein
MLKNIDFVAYVPQYESSWTFTIRGNAIKLSEILNEILDITEKVLDVSKGFFIPTKIEYSLFTYSEDFPANIIFSLSSSNIKRSEFFERKVESETGISYKKFSNDVWSIEIPINTVRYIRRIDMHEGKTRFVLEGKDEFIDRHSKGLYAPPDYKEDSSLQQVLESQAGMDPLMMDISHSSLKGPNLHVESSNPAYYKIVFRTWTDIWFENTEIGRANRNRLRNTLKRVYNSFDVIDTLFISGGFSEEDLKEVVFGLD